MSATSNSTTNYEYVGDGNTLGTIVAQSGDKLGFFGTTPSAQATITDLATGATIATVVTFIQDLTDELQAKGLIG